MSLPRRAPLPLLACTVSLLVAACQPLAGLPSPATSDASTAAPPAPAATAAVPSTATTAAPSPAADNSCPMVFDASSADFYPIQPSFSAGYTAAAQKLSDATADWAYVIEGDYPYAYWMSWYLYTTKGVPLVKLADTDIRPEPGSVNPYVDGAPILAPERHYRITLMPATTPASVVDGMQADGQNVMVMPAIGSSDGVSIVSRAYWSLSNDGLGDYDRFGYGGPTRTPAHTITAWLVDPSTGALTTTPAGDCAAQSQLPERLRYDPTTGGPVITFENVSAPSDDALADLPHVVLQTGSFSGVLGAEFPPAPDPDTVAFYRNVAANTPYADVSAAPPLGDPPDACGGYVMANLPNDVASLVHIPRVPSFPDYTGATASTLNDSASYDVKFYSVVVYGAAKQVDAVGSVENSQLGNRQLSISPDGSATILVYPRSASADEVASLAAVAHANGWNLLKGGLQTLTAPGLIVIREKGASKTWPNSLAPNEATAGAPCPQTTNPDLPLPQDPPDAQVTQFNGMGLSAPQGVNCTITQVLSADCLKKLDTSLASTGAKWSASSDRAPAQGKP